MPDEKTILVTGSTSGIGKEIAIGLAKFGASVIIVGRDENKTRKVAAEVDDTSTAAKRTDYFIADLSSQNSIRSLVYSICSRYKKLDGLVNNAGVFVAHRKETVDGIEYTFALNHLAPFLLTTLLIPLLTASGFARIVTTSSIAHRGARIDFNDITFKTRKYSGIKAYGQSKLANILFTRELVKRFGNSNLTANCFHPGGVRTNLMEENPLLYRIIWSVASPFLITPKEGADTAVYLMTSPNVLEVSGKYFVKRKVASPSAAAQNDETAARLWEASEQMVNHH